jgi:hypothetical protein
VLIPSASVFPGALPSAAKELEGTVVRSPALVTGGTIKDMFWGVAWRAADRQAIGAIEV